jgi:hypothetical protein
MTNFQVTIIATVTAARGGPIILRFIIIIIISKSVIKLSLGVFIDYQTMK